jgi:hypothetical protein
MLQKISGLFTVLLGGILLFGACEQESDSGGGGANIKPSLAMRFFR